MPKKGLTMRQIRELLRLRTCEPNISKRDLALRLGVAPSTARECAHRLVELFFKFIKQNLRIKHFYGTSENAVKTQIWIAVCVYVLVAIIKIDLALDVSLYTFWLPKGIRG